MIKLLIADDQPIFREGLKQILSSNENIVVAGEAESCDEVMKMLVENEYSVLLLDINMPDKIGLDILEDLKSKYPDLPVLILSSYPEKQFAITALKQGASGYLVKKSAPNELVKAIERVTLGEKYISASLAQQLACNLGSEESCPPHERLSKREYQVMCMLAAGKTATEVSGELSLSIKTISTYRARIFEKMKMNNNIELVAYSIKHELVR
jgi:two-component system invasion response regulator UvrY